VTLKYVIINHSLPVLFGEYLKHSDFICVGLVTSAGKVSIDTENRAVFCFGESISLKLKPAKGDDEMIRRLFFDY
jgi:hypothetical protein